LDPKKGMGKGKGKGEEKEKENKNEKEKGGNLLFEVCLPIICWQV